MPKSFDLLRSKMSPKRRARNEARAKEVLAKIAIQDLRRSLKLTQKDLAKILDITQASVSKIESQENMYISTLNRIVIALGGHLKIIASFPDKEVILNHTIQGQKD